jgi:uncharacterized protein YhbP (UPF0306 family)
MNLDQLAKQIIAENEYLSLATIDSDNNPWISIMAYAYDDKYNFYYISQPSSHHSIQIKKNNIVSFSIFDSRQMFGKGVGLQVVGIAREIIPERLAQVEKIYFGRVYPYGDINNDFVIGIKKLLKDKTYLFYEIKITTCWINDPHADTDKRVKLDLS